MASFPENRLDRIEAALKRAVELLPAAAREKLRELTDPETIFGFAVVLGVWGGLQLTPLGGLADVILTAYGALSLGADGIELIRAGIEASEATNQAALEKAAQRLSKALVAVGVDVIATAISSSVFKSVKKLASSLKNGLREAKIERAASAVPGVATPAMAGVGAVNAAPKVGSAAVTFLKFAVPSAGVVLLLVALLGRKTVRKKGSAL